MSRYNRKDAAQLAYDANKKRLRTEVSVLADAVLNEALAEMTEEFNFALNDGEILHVEGTREGVMGYIARATRKQLKR